MLVLTPMKTAIAFILLLLSPMITMAQTELKTIVVDSLYTITVPANMQEVNDLVEGPALQMKYLGNPPLLLTVRAEQKNKIDALDPGFTHHDYYTYVAQRVSEKMTAPELSPPKSDTTAAYTYFEGQVRGTFQG